MGGSYCRSSGAAIFGGVGCLMDLFRLALTKRLD